MKSIGQYSVRDEYRPLAGGVSWFRVRLFGTTRDLLLRKVRSPLTAQEIEQEYQKWVQIRSGGSGSAGVVFLPLPVYCEKLEEEPGWWVLTYKPAHVLEDYLQLVQEDMGREPPFEVLGNLIQQVSPHGMLCRENVLCVERDEETIVYVSDPVFPQCVIPWDEVGTLTDDVKRQRDLQFAALAYMDAHSHNKIPITYDAIPATFRKFQDPGLCMDGIEERNCGFNPQQKHCIEQAFQATDYTLGHFLADLKTAEVRKSNKKTPTRIFKIRWPW